MKTNTMKFIRQCASFIIGGALLAITPPSIACQLYHSDNTHSTVKHDVLYTLLNDPSVACPNNVGEFKLLLENNKLFSKKAMVANRGHHNPAQGSFSFFETVIEGEFFFGHFTGLENQQLILDQSPAPGKLLIELIAWDANKRVFNFYELRGIKTGTRWFYRGDSFDALADNKNLYRIPKPGEAKFGSIMRCSACHNSGGPIMKELVSPHNDWWLTSRPLLFGDYRLSKEASTSNQVIIDAALFAQSVYHGMNKLENSDTYQEKIASLSLQEQLRPLFCTTEINIDSDEDTTGDIQIPSDFWIDARLGYVEAKMSRKNYESLLIKHNVKFPENNLPDAYHAWLAPIRSVADQLAIDKLLSNNVITMDFVKAVLGVDFKHPVFSQQRCHLLKQVPNQLDAHWLETFEITLKNSSDVSAKSLLANLSDAEHGFANLNGSIKTYLKEISSLENNATLQEQAVKKLLHVRQELSSSEISQNPLGQILEPGFRVIFPRKSFESTKVIPTKHTFTPTLAQPVA
ncbi:MAG: hypothetical protein ACHQAX_02975 [Gammaproteobacteria bacterium]